MTTAATTVLKQATLYWETRSNSV